MTVSIQIKERTLKRSKMFGESSHFLISALCVSPKDQMLDMQTIQGHTKFKSTSFVLVSFNEYEDYFVCFVAFWSQPPVSLNFSQATEFHEAGFYYS